MEKVRHPFYVNYETLQVKVAGHGGVLYFSPKVHFCGDIEDGIAFEFDHEGSWVVPLDELREMVRAAEEYRAAHPEYSGSDVR